MRCASAASRVDLDGFNAAMERQKAEARASWAGSGEAATETVWFALRDKAGATEFLGYDTEKAEGVVLALVQRRQRSSTRPAKARRSASSSTRRRSTANPAARWATPARSRAKASRIDVTDTQKKADGLFVHFGKVVKGTVKTGAAVELDGRSCAPHAAARQPFGDASGA